MSIYLRGQTYWITFSVKGRPRVRCSSGTSDREAAQQLHDKMKAESWQTSKLGARQRYTFKEAATRWLREGASKKSLAYDVYKLDHYIECLGDTHLDEMTSASIRQAVEGYRTGVSETTRNRHYALLRAILRRSATDWGWLEVAPHVRLYKERNHVIRWLTPEEAVRLIAELPEHLKGITEFGLATGLRRANLCGLTWAQVDMQRRHMTVEGCVMKNGLPLAVPLNDSAMTVLGRLKGRHPTHVFSFRGKPFAHPCGEAWHAAVKRAGLKDLRFHDLRHTWASWHVQQGTPLHELMEMGGWKSISMVQRYAHLSSERLGKSAAALDGLMPRATMKLVVNK